METPALTGLGEGPQMPPGLPSGLAASWTLPVPGSPVFCHWFTPGCHGAAVGLSPSLTVRFLVLEQGVSLCGPSPPCRLQLGWQCTPTPTPGQDLLLPR